MNDPVHFFEKEDGEHCAFCGVAKSTLTENQIYTEIGSFSDSKNTCLDHYFGVIYKRERSHNMLSWALAFFVIAIIAAIFGFTGIAVGAAEIAKILFVVFVVLFLVSLVAGLLSRP